MVQCQRQLIVVNIVTQFRRVTRLRIIRFVQFSFAIFINKTLIYRQVNIVKRISSTTITHMRVTRGNMQHLGTRYMCDVKTKCNLDENTLFDHTILSYLKRNT
jgi:hypothetical protein